VSDNGSNKNDKTITTEAELEAASLDGTKYDRQAAVRITFYRDDFAAVAFLGAVAEFQATELYLDGKRIARWRHPEGHWLDEHGSGYFRIKIEPVT
jgi:hypothetical protein